MFCTLLGFVVVFGVEDLMQGALVRHYWNYIFVCEIKSSPSCTVKQTVVVGGNRKAAVMAQVMATMPLSCFSRLVRPPKVTWEHHNIQQI
jgi:hypothetical protein